MAVPTVDPSYRPLCWLPADLIIQKMKQRPHCSQTVRCFMLLFSHSAVSDSLWPHGLPHARLPQALLSLGACSDSCPSNRWCHPTISSSVVPFSSCPQSFPTSGSSISCKSCFCLCSLTTVTNQCPLITLWQSLTWSLLLLSVPSPMLVQPHGASGCASEILCTFLPQDLCTCCALYLQYPSPRDSHSSLLHILYVFAKGYLLSIYPIFLSCFPLKPYLPAL